MHKIIIIWTNEKSFQLFTSGLASPWTMQTSCASWPTMSYKRYERKKSSSNGQMKCFEAIWSSNLPSPACTHALSVSNSGGPETKWIIEDQIFLLSAFIFLLNPFFSTSVSFVLGFFIAVEFSNSSISFSCFIFIIL